MTPPGRVRGLSTGAGLILLATPALGLVLSTTVSVFAYRFRMPYWDTTAVWGAWFAAKDNGTLGQLWLWGIGTAEQRVVPLIWFFFFDVWLVRGRGTAMIAGSLAFLATALACVLWSCLRNADLSATEKTATATLIIAPAYSAMHNALARPIFVAQYGQIAFSFLAFAAAASLDSRLADDEDSSAALPLSAIVVAHGIATLWWGTGLAGWCATLVLILVRRWPARLVGCLGAFALANIVAFSLLLPPVIRAGGARVLAIDPAVFAVYVLNYVANPLALVLSVPFEQASARMIAQVVTLLAGIALVAYATELGRRPYRAPGHFELVALQVLVYCLAAGILTAVARSHLGSEQAFSPRYSFHGAWAWVVIVGLAIRGAPRRQRLRRLVVVGTLSVVLLLPAHLAGIARLRGAAEHLRPGYLALLVGVGDTPMLQRVLPETAPLLAVAARLRSERLALFSSPAGGWLDRPLEESFPVTGTPLRGRWRATPIPTEPSGTKLEGEIDGGDVRVRRLVVVSPDGIVRGLGAALRQDDTDRSRTRWYAYVAAPPPLDGYRVYALDDADTVREVARNAAAAAHDWQHLTEAPTMRVVRLRRRPPYVPAGSLQGAAMSAQQAARGTR
jgi:hypothetical protein